MGGLIELLVIVGVVTLILALVFGGRRHGGGWRLLEFAIGLIGALVGVAIWTGLIGTPRVRVPFSILGKAWTLPAHQGVRIGTWLGSLHLPSISALTSVPLALRVVVALILALIVIYLLLRLVSGLAVVAIGAIAGLAVAFFLLHMSSSKIPDLHDWMPFQQINHLLPSLPRSLRLGG
jgi:hypothetical protein